MSLNLNSKWIRGVLLSIVSAGAIASGRMVYTDHTDIAVLKTEMSYTQKAVGDIGPKIDKLSPKIDVLNQRLDDMDKYGGTNKH